MARKTKTDECKSPVTLEVTRRYSYIAHPTAAQKVALAKLFGAVRAVYNEVIEIRQMEHEVGLPHNLGATETYVTTWAKQHHRPWLKEVSSVPVKQAARAAEKAYADYFASLKGTRKGKKLGRPKFKSRRDNHLSAKFTRVGFTLPSITNGSVMLGRIEGAIKFSMHRPLPSDPSGVTIIKRPDGKYELSFVVKVLVPAAVAPLNPGRIAGIDLGLNDYAAIVYSDGTREKIENPRLLKFRLKKLRIQQRALARKQKGSANYTKARLKVASTHQKVSDARKTFHYQLAAKLIHENQGIAVEALNVGALARSMGKGKKGAGFRRSIHDAAWGSFLLKLENKAKFTSRELISVNPAYTSQTCSVCGTRGGKKPLNIRDWVCQVCHSHLDRDYNASVNIMTLAVGQTDSLNACGADVSRELALVATPLATGVEAGTITNANIVNAE